MVKLGLWVCLGVGWVSLRWVLWLISMLYLGGILLGLVMLVWMMN